MCQAAVCAASLMQSASSASLARSATAGEGGVWLQGMDELTPMGTADVVEATQDNIRRYVLEPKDLGINRWAGPPDIKHQATS